MVATVQPNCYSVDVSEIQVMTDGLWDEFVAGDRNLRDYLFLEPHSKLQRQWEVKCDDVTFTAKLDGAISRFGSVSVFKYDEFGEAAKEQGYEIVFMEDPREVFEWKESLNADPGIGVNSKLDGRIDRNGNELRLVRGFLPFQARGINQMRSADRCFYFAWDTGTGKTLAAEGTILVKRESGYGPNKDKGFDVCLISCKPNNLYNTQRKLKEHTGLDATILIGTPKQREKIFAETAAKMQSGAQPILIFTAEKYREDTPWFKLLVEDHNVLAIFDEMPSKYRNRKTALYRATAEVFYTSYVVQNKDKKNEKKIFYPNVNADRPAGIFYVALSGTPIYNSPEDAFNTIRLMDSTVFGTVNNFENLFVGGRDDWGNVIRWKNLDLMGAMCEHIVHMASKETDPDIAAQFPAKLPAETEFCDLDPASEKLYSKLQNEYRSLVKRQGSLLDFDEILAAIGVLQAICSNPRGVLASAKEWDAYLKARNEFLLTKPSHSELVAWEKKNKKGSKVAYKFRHVVGDDSKFTDQDKNGECIVSKLLALRDYVEKHDDKVIVFSDKSDMVLPYISEWFTKWGISHVSYHGELSPKQKQEAQDAFRNDPSIKVFLSTDAGQDSIDLPEASLTCHYSDPWTFASKTQRNNRQHRIDSEKEVVREITLQTPNTVEDRKAEILQIKRGYQAQFQGQIAEQAEEMRKSDFLYILTGER